MIDRVLPPKHKSGILRKVLVTGIIGAFGFGLTELILPNGEWSWMASIFLGSVAFVTQFLVDVERRLDSVEYTYRTESAGTHALIHTEFTRLNEAAELRERMETAALPTETLMNLLRNAIQIDTSAPPLVLELAEAEANRFITFLHELRHGDVTYEGEDRDWLLALTGIAKSTVDAISMHAVDAGGRHFLDTDLGRRYMDTQASAVRRGVRIRRIHVLNPHDPNEDSIREVCARQAQYGIDVRVLNPARQIHSASSLTDFVVFDEVLSYEATSVQQAPGETDPVIVNTRLIGNANRVHAKVETFANLWAEAVPFRRMLNGRETAA